MKTCSVDNGTPVLKDHPELSSRMSEEHISHYMENQPYQVGDQVHLHSKPLLYHG